MLKSLTIIALSAIAIALTSYLFVFVPQNQSPAEPNFQADRALGEQDASLLAHLDQAANRSAQITSEEFNSLSPDNYNYSVHFLEASEQIITWHQADIDGDGSPNSLVVTSLVSRSGYHVFLIDFAPEESRYRTVIDETIPGPIDSITVEDTNLDGLPDLILNLTPDDRIPFSFDQSTGRFLPL